MFIYTIAFNAFNGWIAPSQNNHTKPLQIHTTAVTSPHVAEGPGGREARIDTDDNNALRGAGA